MLEPHEGFGLDIQFARDALVLIAIESVSERDYRQMLGRSSRGRGLCKGIFYPVTRLSPAQVLEKMHSATSLHLCDLERVIRLIWKKRGNTKLA